MTKQGIVDQVYLAVSGGDLSPDIKVSREEIAHLLPAAISYALTVLVRTERKDMIEDFRVFGTVGDGYGSSVLSFLTTQKLPVVLDETTGLYYIALTKKFIRLPGNRGLHDVSPMENTDASYVKVGSRLEVIGLSGPAVFYWAESNRIYFKNIGLPVDDHIVRSVVDFAEYSDSESLPIPGEFEFDVIKLLCEFFREQRTLGTDDTPTDADEK